jgi:nicotinamidase-related amidase
MHMAVIRSTLPDGPRRAKTELLTHTSERSDLTPAIISDKTRYSAFAEPVLLAHLRERDAGELIVSGSETDVCVLATVLDAVDLGYRVIVVRDAVCSSSDEGHDMLMRV